MEGGLESDWKQAEESGGGPDKRGKVQLQNRGMTVTTEKRKSILEMCSHCCHGLALAMFGLTLRSFECMLSVSSLKL